MRLLALRGAVPSRGRPGPARIGLALCACLLLGGLAGSSVAQERDLFRLQLKWRPQAQFMGYFMAQAKGYYEREGLAVEIVPARIGVAPSDAIRDGRADAVVEWMATALRERRGGLPLVNVAQIFQHSGMTLVCRRDRGIFQPLDLRGKAVEIHFGGNEAPFLAWLHALGLNAGDGANDVRVEEQKTLIDGFFDGAADCISSMTYNEYWLLLDRGADLANMTVFQYEDYGFSLLEDGLYVDERRLADAAFRDKLVRFVRASVAGWRYAAANTAEAAFVVARVAEGADLTHQTRMAAEVANLVRAGEETGLLDLDALDRTLGLLPPEARRGGASDARRFWTHEIWEEAVGEPVQTFSRETRYRLTEVLSSSWFYALDLIGTVAFGIAGFMRAKERRYDLWGAFILTFLPAVGGGTLRDLLVGGERHPPFIFKDPTYLYIVIAIVVVGMLMVRFVRFPQAMRRQFDHVMLVTDTLGVAAFTIIGAKVAIAAELEWFWIPICAALTCAGGGVLLDVVTGREPRTFRGEPYEEIAILGGLILIALLHFASEVPFVVDYIVGSICLVMAIVFSLRVLVVVKGWRMPRLRGGDETAEAD